MTVLYRYACFTVFVIFFSACEKKSNEEVKPKEKSVAETVTVKTETEESSKAPKVDLSKEAIEVAKAFEAAIAEADREVIGDLLDLEVILKRSFEGIDLPSGFLQGMRQGMEQGRDRMISDFTSARFDYIKLVSGGEEPVIRFRIRRDDGIDYGDYHFGKNELGEWKIVDTQIYSVGSKLTDLLRESTMPVLAEMDKPLVTRFLKGRAGSVHTASIQKVQEMMTLARQGTPVSAQKAVEIYDSLPEEVQTTKTNLLLYTMATTKLPGFAEPGSRYQKALETFEKTFPNDPSAALHSIDSTILRGDYEAAHKTVAKLQEITGDDYMEFYQGYVYMHEQKYADVEKKARYWIEKHPNDIEGWEMLLEAGFGDNKHAVTVEALKRLEANFEQDYSGVEESPDWAAFRTSAEGKAWLESRTQ